MGKFKHVLNTYTHPRSPPVYICVCECIYVSIHAWMILWKLFSISCILRGADICYFLFKFGMIANKRLNKKVHAYNRHECSPHLKHKNEERTGF